jgi:hypothetical protein
MAVEARSWTGRVRVDHSRRIKFVTYQGAQSMTTTLGG